MGVLAAAGSVCAAALMVFLRSVRSESSSLVGVCSVHSLSEGTAALYVAVFVFQCWMEQTVSVRFPVPVFYVFFWYTLFHLHFQLQSCRYKMLLNLLYHFDHPPPDSLCLSKRLSSYFICGDISFAV